MCGLQAPVQYFCKPMPRALVAKELDKVSMRNISQLLMTVYAKMSVPLLTAMPHRTWPSEGVVGT